MKLFLQHIWALIKKEFILTWLDLRSRGMIIGVPLLQLFIFANTATMEVKNIDLAIFDRDQTVESRELLSHFAGSTHFRTLYYFNNQVEFTQAIDQQDVQLGLEINDGFGQKVRSHQPTEVFVIADGRSTNTAALAAGYAQQIIAAYAKDIVVKPGAAINIDLRNWFNPNLEYQWFMLTVIICMISVVMTLVLTSLSIARERELGTFDQLIVSPLSAWEILAGKTIPPLTFAMGITFCMSFAVRWLYGVPMNGSLWLLLFSTFAALLSMVGVGLFFSSICKTQQQAMLSSMTFIAPITLTAGYISPIGDMPVILQYLTYANPMRWYVSNVKGIFLKALPMDIVLENCIPLVIIATVTLSVAAWTFKKNME